MSQTEKAAYFQALKAAGVTFDRHYREYNTAELQQAYAKGVANGSVRPIGADAPSPAPDPTPEPFDAEATAAAFAKLTQGAAPPVAAKDPNEMAGARLNSKEQLEAIRTDEQGRVWFQEEVLKPAYPKPRGRRVLTYQDPGVQEKTVRNGAYQETFEIAGDPKNARPATVKITLPSYQVGIYKDPRFPFKVITYNGNDGFDLFDVQDFYGGSEMVPGGVKRKYVENVLCYDIRTVVRDIQAEARRLQLSGRI